MKLSSKFWNVVFGLSFVTSMVSLVVVVFLKSYLDVETLSVIAQFGGSMTSIMVVSGIMESRAKTRELTPPK